MDLSTPFATPGPLLTVFFDGSCALCRAEMDAIAALDPGGEIHRVDCSDPAFDDTPWRVDGVDRAAMMGSLHVRDVLGDWHRGPDAIALLYATVGAPALARAWAHPWTRPLMRRLYPWLARHRQGLSALGLHLVAPRVLHAMAWRNARYARCDHGCCRMPGDDGPGAGPSRAARASAGRVRPGTAS